MRIKNYCIIISGPTGVGKTEFADRIASQMNAEIINGDMGQLYAPLTIGTAKPNWQQASAPHHLFDIMKEPTLFSASAFRDQVHERCRAIWKRNNIPIIVGGSAYYNAALFFPPMNYKGVIKKQQYNQEQNLWQKLYAIDPERAAEIDSHDIYRIERALDIWSSTGVKPSVYKPTYSPIADFIYVWLERDRPYLYDRINDRVLAMVRDGLLDEARTLLGTPWEPFLYRKKIIGYEHAMDYCYGKINKEQMIKAIQQATRKYAKRQLSFWNTFRQKLKKNIEAKKSSAHIVQVNLTHGPIARYIEHVKSLINHDNLSRGQ